MELGLFPAEVMHKRYLPKVNQFQYGVYYLAFPLSKMHDMADGWRFGVNRFGLLSFYEKDHGERDGSTLEPWVRKILKEHNVTEADGEILLVTMPRVLGYVFNPVSFFFCLDKKEQLRAVICEVNNTFGENHDYLCVLPGHQPMTKEDWIKADKLFHVSPFLEREGHYQFRFALHKKKIGIWIDYYNQEQKKQLITSLIGSVIPYNRRNTRKVFWNYPLVTIKTIVLIHVQAIRLWLKGIVYVPKPTQRDQRMSKSKK